MAASMDRPDSGVVAEAVEEDQRDEQKHPDSEQELRGLSAALAEIEEEADEEDDSLEQPSRSPSQEPVDLPDKLWQMVDLRIALWKQLAGLEDLRQEIDSRGGNRDVRSEISRQNSELKRMPNRDALSKATQRITTKAKQAAETARKLAQPADEEADGTSDKPTDNPEDVALYRKILAVGLKQNQVLTAREKLNDVVPTTAEPALKEEPLYKLCARNEVDALPLLGWTYYALAVEHRIQQCRDAERAHQDQVADAVEQHKSQKTGLLNKFLGDSKNGAANVPPLDPDVGKVRLAADRELKAVEVLLTNLFWELFEEVAWLLADGKLEKDEEVYARAMLRYGLVATDPALMGSEQLEYILKDCRQDVAQWNNSPMATHAVYADEYVCAVYNQETTVSPDEDLELNERGSERWKADRTWRQVVFNQVKLRLYEEVLGELNGQVEELTKQADEMDEKFKDLKKNHPDKKAEAAELRQQLLDLRPQVTRYRQMVERLEEKLVPELRHAAESARDRMGEACEELDHEAVVRREAKFIRRLARLAARLKTPYPHFVLRDNFKPDNNDHHSRKKVIEAIERVEYADHYLFHEVIVPNKKRDRQLTVRLCPTFLIVPARGVMGISINQRTSTDAGNLMVPLLGQRGDMIEGMVTEILADYGWDCSMEEAGADWITSDSLCAAYAAVRWNYRSKPPKAQKRAGFDKKKRDRQDWRGHYALYVASVKDAGRKLFYKCYDVYEVIVKYIGLPEGMERLRRD